MINQEKIDFLNKYTLSKKFYVKILSTDEIINISEGIVPSEWKEIFIEVEKSHKINKMLKLWKKNVENEMSNTISFLNEFLIDIEIMNIGDRYSILYSVKNPKGKVLYYEGRNPKDIFNNEQLKKDWSKIPENVRGFYENLHNGFYYYPSKSMGLSSLENVAYLDEYEWGIIDDIGEQNLKIN